jgi:hypothetical protein
MSNLEHAIRHSDLNLGPRSRVCEPASDQWQSGDAARIKGCLGVLVDTFDLAERPGATVVGTIAGSAAARVGLAAGDTITSVCGIGLSTAVALGKVISIYHAGEHVNLTWIAPGGDCALRERPIVTSASPRSPSGAHAKDAGGEHGRTRAAPHIGFDAVQRVVA